MKAVIEKTQYIKDYKYKSWTQPIFGSNSIIVDGVVYKLTTSHGYSTAFHAFDGDTTTNQRCWWTGNVNATNANPCWICLYCSSKLKLTSVNIMNEKYQPENPITGNIQVSNDGVNWRNVGTFVGTNTASYVTTVPLAVDQGYHYYRAYFTDEWADGVSLQEITYFGQIAEEITVIKPTTTYKKITGYENWTQPVFTDNKSSDGCVITSSSDDSQSKNYCWRAMDGQINISGNGSFFGFAQSTGWWELKLPYYIAITKLVHYNRDNASYSNITGRYYADSDMKIPIGPQFTNATSWGQTVIYDSSTPIITNTIYFRKTAGGDYSGIGQLEITALKVLTGRATSTDYDIEETLKFETVTKTTCKLPTRVGLEYYKWDKPNLDIVGTPTNNQGVVSGFTTQNYLVLPQKYKSNYATYVFKFTTGSDFSVQQIVVHGEYLLNLEIATDQAVIFYNWGSKSSTTLFKASANSTYWVKVIISGTTKTYSYSTDGKTFTGSITITDSGVNPSNTSYQFRLGLSSYNTNYPFLGSIDLINCYATQNNEIWWRGYTEKQGTRFDYNFTREVTNCLAVM